LEEKASERFREVIKRYCLNCKNLIKIKAEKIKEKNSKQYKEKNLKKTNKSSDKELHILEKNANDSYNNYNSKNMNNSNNLNGEMTSEEKIDNITKKNKPKITFKMMNSRINFQSDEETEKFYNLSYNKNSFVKYYKFPLIQTKFKQDNPIEESYDPHVICELCVDIINQEILNKVRLRTQKGKKEVIKIAEIKCILCLKEHQVEYKNFKKFVKTGFQRCCSVL